MELISLGEDRPETNTGVEIKQVLDDKCCE